jgi:hypothetical protein
VDARIRSSLATVLFLVACSTQVGPSPRPFPTVSAVSPSRLPPDGFVPYTSAASGYRACHPEGWQVREDWAAFGAARGDSFLGGLPNELPAVLSVVSEPAPGYDTTQYVEGVLLNLRSAGYGVERVGAVSVEGLRAERLSFSRLTARQDRYLVQQIVWADGGRGWVLSSASPVSSADSLSHVLLVIAACFSTH